MNLATLLEGPCNVTHRGQVFHFRGGLRLTPIRSIFKIETDTYGPIALRALDRSIVLSGTPVGVWTALQLAVTHRWTNPQIGSLVTPRYDISSVTAATDVIVLVGSAQPRAGCPVRVIAFPGATIPAGIVTATTYFWNTGGKLYDTEAHAITGGATGLLDITDAGTGDLAIIEQESIQIDALTANRRITFWNGAVIGMPALGLSAVQSALGALTFAVFPKEGSAWGDANNLYTITKVALTDTPPTAAEIPSQEYSAAFGAAPWDSFKSRGPIVITPSLRTEPIVTDGLGLVGMKIAGIDVSATLQPEGRSEAQMLDLLGLQAGAVRGADAKRADLAISGTGVFVTLYNGAARELPQTFDSTSPRAGELAIDGVRTPGSNAFYVGVTAP
jgi:hypothetical protein